MNLKTAVLKKKKNELSNLRFCSKKKTNKGCITSKIKRSVSDSMLAKSFNAGLESGPNMSSVKDNEVHPVISESCDCHKEYVDVLRELNAIDLAPESDIDLGPELDKP